MNETKQARQQRLEADRQRRAETREAADTAAMALIIHECCRRVRPDLVGPVTETRDGAAFSVTSSLTGKRYLVTVTEEGSPS